MIYKNVEEIRIEQTDIINQYSITLSGSFDSSIATQQTFSGSSDVLNSYFWSDENEVFSTTCLLNGSDSKAFFETNVLNYAPGFDNYIVLSLSKAYYMNGILANDNFKLKINSDIVTGILKLRNVIEDMNDFECYEIVNGSQKYGILDINRGLIILDLALITETTPAKDETFTKKIIDYIEYIKFNSKETKYFYAINCVIGKNDCLYSTNKTFVDQYGKIVDVDLKDEKSKVSTYATSIYFKDYNNNLLAVAKFNPEKIGSDLKTFNVRIFLR